jgi:hypothetical protein
VAGEDLRPHKKYVVFPRNESYKMADDIAVISLPELAQRLITT